MQFLALPLCISHQEIGDNRCTAFPSTLCVYSIYWISKLVIGIAYTQGILHSFLKQQNISLNTWHQSLSVKKDFIRQMVPHIPPFPPSLSLLSLSHTYTETELQAELQHFSHASLHGLQENIVITHCCQSSMYKNLCSIGFVFCTLKMGKDIINHPIFHLNSH